MFPDMTVSEYRKYAALRVEALVHALRGIPREKERGSPHAACVPGDRLRASVTA
jgi:hypothetical protein